MEYLVDTYAEQAGRGDLRPARGTPDYRRYQYWMHYAEGSLMPLMLLSLVFLRLPKAPMPFLVRKVVEQVSKRTMSSFVTPQVTNHLEHVERALGESLWFAGAKLTAADIQMSFPIEAAAARAGLDTRYPKLTAYRERIKALPAYQQALARGGALKL